MSLGTLTSSAARCVAWALAAVVVATAGCAPGTEPGGRVAPAADGPSVAIVSPPNNTALTWNPAGTDVTVAVVVGDAALDTGQHLLRFYLDGVEVAEATTAAPYTYVDLPFGMHHLAARLVASDGAALPNPGSLDAIYVKLQTTCDSGLLGGEAVCEDGLACTAHSCNTDVCNYGPVAGCCDSELECDYGWYCIGGTCIECLSVDDCDDGDVCTEDLCGVSGLCLHNPVPGCCNVDQDCDDGDVCNLDACDVAAHACGHVDAELPGCCNIDADCEPEDPCQAYLCYHNTVEGYDICRYGPQLVGCCTSDAQCYDGNPCTLDQCQIDGESGLCAYLEDPGLPSCCIKHSDCDDGDPATKDACVANACVYEEDELFCALPESSIVVLNELMIDPADLPDPWAEWIELYNAHPTDLIDLEGWTVETSLGESFEIGLANVSGGPAGMMLPPRSYFVLARSGDLGINGGFQPNAVYGDALSLLDPAEVGGEDVVLTITLRTAQGVVIDTVTYDTATWPVEYGRSLELSHAYADNALAASWRAAGHHENPAKNKTYGPHGLWGSPKNSNQSSFAGLQSAACTPGPGAHPCALGYCDMESQCFFELADGCCVADADCADFDACTADQCDAGSLSCLPAAPEPDCCNLDSECDDGNPCNLDRCLNHECRYTPNFLPGCCTSDADCDDGSPCTLTGCDVPANACLEPIAIAPADSTQCCSTLADCEDDDPSTLNVCGEDHVCDFPGDPTYCDSTADCDDGSVCTDDGCNLAENVCLFTAIAGCCEVPADCPDDGDPCTLGTCDAANVCGVVDLDGCCVDDAECDDGAPCTDDSCGSSNTCHNLPLAGCCVVDGDCDDGVPCTSDACVGGACASTALDGCCTPGGSQATLTAECGLDPDGPAECWSWSCNAAGACLALTQASCCETSADCDDGNDCTSDLCPIATLVCKHLPLTSTGCCVGDADCAPDQHCSDDGACLQDLPPGATCAGESECQSGCCQDLICAPFLGQGDACAPGGCACASGFCVDGYCCDGACDAQCMSCGVVGAEGACTDGCAVIGFDIDSAVTFQRTAGGAHAVDWFVGWGPGGYETDGSVELEWGDFPPGDDALGPP